MGKNKQTEQTHETAFESEPFWMGRTFDDFLLRPQKGVSTSRSDIGLRCSLTNNIALELPLLSANMDSVTGARMATAMATAGGLGVIHRNMSVERQAAKIAQVKRAQGALIEAPFTLPVGTTIRHARAFARQHDIAGILIETVENSTILAGILSARDIPWNEEYFDCPVEQFMTPFDQLVTASPDISMEEASRRLFDRRVERLPLIDEQHRIHGLITRKDIVALGQQPWSTQDDKGRLRVGAAVGARGDYLERASALIEAEVDCIFVDIAHGHSVVMEECITKLKDVVGEIPLICGNVATGEGAKFLRDCGADAIKVGVGPGRGCRTRLETAAGVPQLQAIREAWYAVGNDVPIIADGGVQTDKDIFMASIAGASTVMLGSFLSGTDEAPGRVIEDPATHAKKKIYRGMTSPEAVFEALYDADKPDELDAALETPAEGQEMQVPYRGSVKDILERIRGHLRSSVSYGGEDNLKAVRNKVLQDPERYLIPLSNAARRESYER